MSDDGESLSERQEFEVQALKAIYDKDFEDLRERDVWKVRRAPEFLIKLRPNHDSQGLTPQPLCSVDLHVKCSDNYPLSPPTVIKPVNAKGLSVQQVQELQEKLIVMAKKNVGEVMIMEIGQQVSLWLDVHNKSAKVVKEVKSFASFHEAMEARTKADQERKKEEDLKKVREKNILLTTQEREAIREEVLKTKEALKEEKLQRKEEEKRRFSGNNDFLSSVGIADNSSQNRKIRFRRTSQTVSEGSDTGGGLSPIDAKYKALRSLTFNMKGESVRVHLLSQVGRNDLGGVVFSGIIPSGSSKLVAVSEWNFRTRSLSKKVVTFDAESSLIHDEPTLAKQINSIEQELSSMQKLTHPNVVPYYGLSMEHHPSLTTVRVFEEFVYGTNFSHFLTENLPVELSALRHYISSVLEALAFMHQHNFVHRDIRETSIYIESSGRVRLGDFSIDKRIRDLISDSKEGDERYPLAIGRGGKKVDIFRLGVVALSLAQGEFIHDVYIPKSLPPDFANFLKHCFDKDERERWSAEQLLEHAWIKTPIKSPMRQSNRDETFSPEAEEEEATQPMPFCYLSGQSRLQSEFSYIGEIGKGGFGEVIKVKNNLDSQVYAIKRICLDPNNKQLTKKIMREVKLLSRLNHENVVRYYNSWIEVTTRSKDNMDDVDTSVNDSSNLTDFTSTTNNRVTSVKNAHNKNLDDSFAFLAPKVGGLSLGDGNVQSSSHEIPNADWSISFSSYRIQEGDDSESEESSDEEDIFGISYLPGQNDSWNSGEDESESDSDSEIVFEVKANDDDDDDSGGIVFAEKSMVEGKTGVVENVKSIGGQSALSNVSKKHELHFMYIQMEYCDKQTLRSAIDEGLYKNTERVWRMFREIIEGLVHIHTQGMIHRDLKPTNIFLDGGDHIKIGDFGLATASQIGRWTLPPSSPTMDMSLNETSFDGDMTGQIGTALYVAPEMNAGKTIATYNQKVDIYSLGIIFFEMCHTPLKTGMERVQILNALRSADVILPDDFSSIMIQQSYILRWLLNHDPAQRPTSLELLQSDYLPPPLVEEAELRELIRHTLANKKSKAYRYLIDSCLSQKMSDGGDIAFDTEIPNCQAQKKTHQRQEYVRKVIQRVFELHGAVHVNAPQLLPKSSLRIYDRTDKLVIGMSKSGDVTCLPFDLRVPFARYIARTKTNNMRRYCIAPVFREKLVYGVQPKELLECAFDIVTPTEGSLIADAEVLSVSDKIMQSFPSLRDVKYFFRINHLSLLQGILLHFGISEEEHRNIFNLILEGEKWSKQQRVTHLLNLGIAEPTVTKLLGILEREGSIEHLNGVLKPMMKRKNQAASDIKQGLLELEAIIGYASTMGVKGEILIAPSLVFHPDYFRGMVCQLVKKKPKGQDILAVGGRYDNLIAEFVEKFNIVDDVSSEPAQCAVGVSISLDRIAAVVSQEEMTAKFSAADVLICSSVHHESLVKKKLELADKLWSHGIRCFVCDIHLSVDDVIEIAADCGASFVAIILDSDGNARLKNMTDKEKITERRITYQELSEFLPRHLVKPSSEVAEHSGSSTIRAESVSRPSEVRGSVQLMFNHRFVDRERRTLAFKKKLETVMSSKLLPNLSSGLSVSSLDVLVLSLPGAVIRSIAGGLDFEDEVRFSESVTLLIERHPRHKKDLSDICQEIRVIKFVKGAFGLVLYSCDDHVFKLIV